MVPRRVWGRGGAGLRFRSLKVVRRRVLDTLVSEVGAVRNGRGHRFPSSSGTMHFYLSTGNTAMVLMLTGGAGA